MAAPSPLDPEKLEGIINKLLAVKGNKAQRQVLLKEDEINDLLGAAHDVFMSQPMLLELNPPLKVIGDLHGQYYDLLKIFDKTGQPPTSNFLFLGDYVDRGKHSMEVICLLWCYKVKFRENFFLLRGNHECAAINRMYGFFDDVKRRYHIKLWKHFTEVFLTMPCAAVIGEKIMCMHGGLSPELLTVDGLKRVLEVKRPVEVPEKGVLCDLLWADPEEDITGFVESDRGVSYLFGADVVDQFLNATDMDLVIRAHQVMDRGYGFFADRQMVTIFSAPNYCGEFDNDAAVMNVNEQLQCSFQILHAKD